LESFGKRGTGRFAEFARDLFNFFTASLFQRGNFLGGAETPPFDGLRAGFWEKRGRGDFWRNEARNYVANF